MSSTSPACDTYRGALACLRHGHALWEPSPIYSYQRVRLGDVGYIRDGGFHLLFSAGVESGSGVHSTGVPPGFEQLRVGPIVRHIRDPGSLRSSTVKQIGAEVGGSLPTGSPVRPGVKMNFELTSKQGATLITADPTYREDIERRGDAENYTKKHYRSWVDFARAKGHGDVKPILVIGVDLTKNFASMACSDCKTRLRCDFSVGTPAGDPATLSVWGSWSTEDPLVHTNCGPSLLLAQENQDEGSAPESTTPADHNQCVFIRYYTMRWQGFVLKAGAGPHQLPAGDTGNYDNGTGAVAVGTFDPDGDSTQDASLNVTNDAPPDDCDGFDIVAKYVFQRTKATSLLLHDGDIADLVQEGETEAIRFLDESRIIEQVEVDENGVGKLVPMTPIWGDEVSYPGLEDFEIAASSHLQETESTKTRQDEPHAKMQSGELEQNLTPIFSSPSRRRPCWDVYRELLREYARGEALWETSPNSKRIRLGDVGYIRYGKFHLLFSAGIPLGTRRLGIDVPDTFEFLDFGEKRTSLLPPGCRCAGDIEIIEMDSDAPLAVPSPAEPNTTAFNLTGERGAVVITSHPAYCEDMPDGPPRKYTKKHFVSWVEFAREKMHGDVLPILVSGVDLTKQVASLAYSGNKAGVRCVFSAAPVDLVRPAVWGSWYSVDPSVSTRCGSALPPAWRPGSTESFTSGSAIPEDYNQCVYIRYYTMLRKLTPAMRIMDAGVEPGFGPPPPPPGVGVMV